MLPSEKLLEKVQFKIKKSFICIVIFTLYILFKTLFCLEPKRIYIFLININIIITLLVYFIIII